MKLARAYLGEFEIVDAGRILPADWKVAKQIAHRILRDRSPRQLGDCIIRAICNRLHLEVLTADRRFPS
jgi:predicted nucleic acid-binding protein